MSHDLPGFPYAFVPASHKLPICPQPIGPYPASRFVPIWCWLSRNNACLVVALGGMDDNFKYDKNAKIPYKYTKNHHTARVCSNFSLQYTLVLEQCDSRPNTSHLPSRIMILSYLRNPYEIALSISHEPPWFPSLLPTRKQWGLIFIDELSNTLDYYYHSIHQSAPQKEPPRNLEMSLIILIW